MEIINKNQFRKTLKINFNFIYFVKIIAIILITTAHYEKVYPANISDLLASGGNLGNTLFFISSGFLIDVSRTKNFFRWIIQKYFRLFLGVWLIYIFLWVISIKEITENNFFNLVILGSEYHFIGRLFVLYFIGFLILKVDALYNNLFYLGLFSIIIQLLLYISFDKSIYSIDSIGGPMINFLFFNSFIIGILLRKMARPIIGYRLILFSILFFSLIAYFIISILLRNGSILEFQIISPFSLLILSFFIFNSLWTIEFNFLDTSHKSRFLAIKLSSITLEIYLIQIPFISILNIGPFPINFLFVSFSILFLAQILHIIVNSVHKILNKII